MRRIGLVLAFAVLAAPVASAQPQLELRWDGCGGTRLVEPYTSEDHVLTVSLVGAEGDYDGIEFTISIDGHCNVFYGEAGYLPHAWRFDSQGCQAGLVRVIRPTADGPCPGLVPTFSFESVTLGTNRYYPDGPGPGVDIPALFVRIGSAFPLKHLSASNRYVVAKITFPMQGTVAGIDPNGVLCGCAQMPQVIQPISAMLSPGGPYDTFVGSEVWWVQDCNQGAYPTPCMTVPAHSLSWGVLKATYR